MGRKTAANKAKQMAASADSVVEERKRKAEELEKRRQRDVVISPLTLDGNTLIKRYAYMWGRETKGHKVLVVLPDSPKEKTPSDSYRFFCMYFYCGLSPLL